VERRAALVVELVAGTFEGGCTALREQELAGASWSLQPVCLLGQPRTPVSQSRSISTSSQASI